MKSILLILSAILTINGYAQYDTVNTITINNIQLRLDTEADVINKLGSPTQIKEEIDYAGDGDVIKVYCYENSYFKFWNEKVQTFLIKNSSYTFNDKFSVGDNITVFQNHYPNSFQNPLSSNQISSFDISNFEFDKSYWINAGGGDGVLVFSKDNIIIGFRYSVG